MVAMVAMVAVVAVVVVVVVIVVVIMKCSCRPEGTGHTSTSAVMHDHGSARDVQTLTNRHFDINFEAPFVLV